MARGMRDPIRSGRRAGAVVLAGSASLLITAAGWPSAVSPAPAGITRPEAVAAVLTRSPAGLMPSASGTQVPQSALPFRLRQADLLIVSAHSLPPAAVAAVSKLHGVAVAEPVDAARVTVAGRYIAMLGVDPSGFRRFAAGPTARDSVFWNKVAAGAMGVSYTMGKQGKLPVGAQVSVTGRQRRVLTVGGMHTVGIAGVDAVVSHAVARSLGFPMGNALVISAPHARLAQLTTRLRALMPKSALVEQLVVAPATKAGQAGGQVSGTAGNGLSYPQLRAVLRAALSRVGMPYVWGAAGPSAFDCSGLVQWSFAQAGIVMPRVAADQARTGPAVPVSRLKPGDLLFYHTDPTAPGYISHVAMYLGRGWMIQAPQPGMKVEVVPVWLGSEFAGAVAVSPRIAAQVAASPVG